MSTPQQMVRVTPELRLPLPPPRVAVRVRLATMEDLPCIDALQKQHRRALGFFPRAQMQGYVERGWMLVAEEGNWEGIEGSRGEGIKVQGAGASPLDPSFPRCLDPLPAALRGSAPMPLRPSLLGYIAFRDRYQKRDELGAVFQLCVAPGSQRKFIGAALLRDAFDRSAYGCKLYCCWCAQDLAANNFWESMGFVPLAFRAGSSRRSRVHIFWQKRIRPGDATTPWWFPCDTAGGAIREDRIVLPIPPGTHWSEVKPPELLTGGRGQSVTGAQGAGEVVALATPRRDEQRVKSAKAVAAPSPLAEQRRPVPCNGLHFDIPAQPEKTPPPAPLVPAPATAQPPKRTKAPKAKNDPRLVAAARELRDRWLEQLNAAPLVATGKYYVTRALPDGSPSTAAAAPPSPARLLPAA